MDTAKGIIEVVKQREKNYSIAIKGAWYSGFGICKYAEGDLIEFEFAKSPDGKFNNIKRVISSETDNEEEVIEEHIEEPKKDMKTVQQYNDNRTDDIHWQVCLKIAADILNTHTRELPTAAGIVMYAKDLMREAFK